ncbi:MAG: staygreen family protein [Vulcanibacillus sp.]
MLYLNRLNPEKLSVELRPGVTATEPIIPRSYTLTHSDTTAELFLTIGREYAYDKITSMRDEVLAEWQTSNGALFLYVYVYVGNYGPVKTPIRNTIFRRELPLALEAIVYGDSKFFIAHPKLANAPIWIYFDSIDTRYKRFEYWGTPTDYK